MVAEERGLSIRQSVLPSRGELDVMLTLGDQFLKSGLLPTSIKTAAAAVLIIQKGVELRIPPAYALSNIQVVEGKPTEKVCTISYKRRTAKERRIYSFTMDDAKAAELFNKATWKKYPKAMLRARCISAVARMAFPDSIAGMYTPEELGVEESPDGGLAESLPAERQPATVADVTGSNDFDRESSRRKFFALAKGTQYESEDGRAAFISSHTNGRVDSLKRFLTGCSEADAIALVSALELATQDTPAPRIDVATGEISDGSDDVTLVEAQPEPTPASAAPDFDPTTAKRRFTAKVAKRGVAGKIQVAWDRAHDLGDLLASVTQSGSAGIDVTRFLVENSQASYQSLTVAEADALEELANAPKAREKLLAVQALAKPWLDEQRAATQAAPAESLV
jgi:hypothetical protein